MANTQLYPAGRGQEERGERLEEPTTPPAARSPRTAPSPNVSLCTQGLDVTWSPRALQLIFMEKKKKNHCWKERSALHKCSLAIYNVYCHISVQTQCTHVVVSLDYQQPTATDRTQGTVSGE